MNFLEICVFDKFILAGELYAKSLRSFEIYLSVSNDFCGKLVLSVALPVIFSLMFAYSLRVIFSSLFAAHFNLKSCESNDFSFILLQSAILY